ncbi:MAG: DUF1015 domain-containing protein [Candidatus Limimorpha sp.]|nr:DUF1015 domain-containing protein [Bacteroidales bacterium]MDD5979103.1 DUF1015 family protein [Bacteroidales bacterium]MDD7277392.1 DUF1015 family protein [Bacteroidales bacterium]MDY6075413.1 DUF1015 family protein [Bacteroidales bacterium]
MSVIKPFKGYRPTTDIVEKLASRPYDVLNTEEARQECAGNPYSLLHVTKAEIDLPEGTKDSDTITYVKVVENFNSFKDYGWLVQDKEEKLYIYAQSMNPTEENAHWQYGIVACAWSEDYINKVIKKHELTRKDKEEDRMKHVRITNANVEPVFFAYPAVNEIDAIVDNIVRHEKPVYDFIAKEDGFGHRFWTIDDKATIDRLVELFATKVPAMYIADGHHRSAAAALVGQEKKENNPNHTGKEEYNYFMTVIFPDNQLKIIDYNRVVKDLNGLSKEDFIAALGKTYVVEDMGTEIYKPAMLHEHSMYLDGHWYKMTAKPGTFDDNDPIGVLDVKILSDNVLDNILGIKDLRTDKRIDFVGGIRGLGELKRRVDSGEMAVAFAMYPVSMKQIIDIADSGNIMPPKTTWFEPKLRSGLVIHTLE